MIPESQKLLDATKVDPSLIPHNLIALIEEAGETCRLHRSSIGADTMLLVHDEIYNVLTGEDLLSETQVAGWACAIISELERQEYPWRYGLASVFTLGRAKYEAWGWFTHGVHWHHLLEAAWRHTGQHLALRVTAHDPVALPTNYEAVPLDESEPFVQDYVFRGPAQCSSDEPHLVHALWQTIALVHMLLNHKNHSVGFERDAQDPDFWGRTGGLGNGQR